MSRRAEKLSEEIKRELSQILQNEIKDPRIPELISVTNVDVTRDLSYAKASISMMADEEVKKNAMIALDKAKGFIRRELGRRLTLRSVPEIAFFSDASIEHGVYINQLIEKVIKSEENKRKNDGV
ncbi:MAG: Ribosome-binding factor A [Firmicutes bacterium]|nr:Ribosome-binding factor A [Bacillota bacterium]MDI6704721.1 30S ribosome-binding factor RbfA [Bacillota bacterium]